MGTATLDLNRTQKSICEVCDSVKEMLLAKNRKYGNSVLEPVRIFSKADTYEQIRVRLDDKLSRLRNAQSDEDEDVIKDLIGYLVFLVIAREQREQSENCESMTNHDISDAVK